MSRILVPPHLVKVEPATKESMKTLAKVIERERAMTKRVSEELYAIRALLFIVMSNVTKDIENKEVPHGKIYSMADWVLSNIDKTSPFDLEAVVRLMSELEDAYNEAMAEE